MINLTNILYIYFLTSLVLEFRQALSLIITAQMEKLKPDTHWFHFFLFKFMARITYSQSTKCN